MPRPKEFDPDEALDRAMHLFWEKGYAATSMQELVDRTGVHRASLYSTFGNKEDLFAAALARFPKTSNLVERFEALKTSASPLHDLRGLLERLAEQAARGHGAGCPLASTVAALQRDDDRLAKLASSILRRREDQLEGILSHAQDLGELAAGHDTRQLARFLNTILIGVGTLARGAAEPALVRDSVKVALAALD